MMKKTVSALLALILCASALAGFSACGKKEDPNTFSYFLYSSNKKYDTSYKQNPGIEWLESKEFAGVHIDLEMMLASKSSSAAETMQTLIAAGDYPDIIDYQAMSTQPLSELYEDGVIMDITPYVTEYMPNYMQYLEDHPDIAASAYTDVNGEKKILNLYCYNEVAGENCWSYSYRRDWIAKYGKNPLTGEEFSYGYDEEGNWTDNIIFPNGENVPIYLSDWMWMFDIFKIALSDLNLQDDSNAYCISIPYAGIDQLGGLCGAFNTNYYFYLDNDLQAQFGAESDNMRVYFQAMNDWYNKGYVDKAFYERNGDSAWQINLSSISAGKVGMWYGGLALFKSNIRDKSDPLLEDAFIVAARPPLNDVYGKGTYACYDAETNPFNNNNLFTVSKVKSPIVISTAAKDKNLEALFSMLNYMYTVEWTKILDYGYNEEQQELMQNQVYKDLNFNKGYIDASYEDGTPMYNEDGERMVEILPEFEADSNLHEALTCQRVFGMHKFSLRYYRRDYWLKKCYDEMMNFKGSGYIQDDAIARLSNDMNAKYKDVVAWCQDASAQLDYMFITGALDPNSDADYAKLHELFDTPYKNGQTYGEVVDELVLALRECYKA